MARKYPLHERRPGPGHAHNEYGLLAVTAVFALHPVCRDRLELREERLLLCFDSAMRQLFPRSLASDQMLEGFGLLSDVLKLLAKRKR